MVEASSLPKLTEGASAPIGEDWEEGQFTVTYPDTEFKTKQK
jgi:hypothetical protein